MSRFSYSDENLILKDPKKGVLKITLKSDALGNSAICLLRHLSCPSKELTTKWSIQFEDEAVSLVSQTERGVSMPDIIKDTFTKMATITVDELPVHDIVKISYTVGRTVKNLVFKGDALCIIFDTIANAMFAKII